MFSWRWSSTAFRWPELNLSPDSILRWPRSLLSSHLRQSWIHGLSGFSPRWVPQNIMSWWRDSIVDDVVWSLVTAVESVAVVSMICFFLVSYGCTI